MDDQTPNNQTPPTETPQAQAPAPQNQGSAQVVVHKSGGFKSKLPWIIIVLLLIIIAIFGGYVILGQAQPNQAPAPSPTPQAATPCTLEAKLCPDGSSVGREGPNCEFAACPATPSAENSEPPTSSPTGSLD